MYESVATLKAYGTPSYDMYGNEIESVTTSSVYVMPRGVYNAEFYNAAQAGLHPSITFEITNRADYHGEKVIEWEGKDYNVIRTDWTAQKDRISLICEEKVDAGIVESQDPPTPPTPEPEPEEDENDG